MSQAETFTVEGSCGKLICDAETGLVLRYDYGSENYSEDYYVVFAIDIWELRRFYPEFQYNTIAGQSFDILDCGFWTSDGGYEPPEFDWREFKNECQKRA